MRTLTVLSLLALVTVTVFVAPATSVSLPDGATAWIRPDAAILARQHGTDGNYAVILSIYQKVGGTWTQVSMPATLRVFVYSTDASATPGGVPASPFVASGDAAASSDGTVQANADIVGSTASASGRWVDAVSVPFTSSASAASRITFSSAAIGTDQGGSTPEKSIDVFVTFAASGLEGHTSHFGNAHAQLISTAQSPTGVTARDQLMDVADATDYYGSNPAVAA